jgi:hypothetical protein
MTCFWNSIISGLQRVKDLPCISQSSIRDLYHRIHQPNQFVQYLKNNNIKSDHVKFNGQFLSQKRKDENFEAISSFDVNSIYHGYFCAFEEPFLFLVCELFKINIFHTYNGHNAHYIYDGVNNNICIHLSSNSSHMNFVKTSPS